MKIEAIGIIILALLSIVEQIRIHQTRKFLTETAEFLVKFAKETKTQIKELEEFDDVIVQFTQETVHALAGKADKRKVGA